MNHCVPDFEMEDDYAIPSMPRPKKPNMAGDEIMELLWQNGQVVMQSQRSAKKPLASGYGDELIAADRREVVQPSSHHDHQQQQSLFMQEEEMASWLLNETPYDFCSDLLYSSASPCVNAAPALAAATTATATATAPTNATATTTTATASAGALRPHAPEQHRQLLPSPRPPVHPVPPSRRMENFGHLSRLSRFREGEPGPSHSDRPVNDATVVDSSDTPAAGRPHSRVSEAAQGLARGGALPSLATSLGDRGGGGGGEEAAYEATVTSSSPGGSSGSAEPPSQKPPPPPPDGRKRKAASEADDADCQSEDVDVEFADGKKHPRGSSSTKRSRAAEVHNLSERRRRDRINEKMRALQELIPHCNKADKASMLDEAIEYLKSLQMQVQMMSMGCSMMPMMFPGVPQYMPHMGMGIGMGMGMEMGMNRPMMPFPNVLAGSPLAAPGAAAHMGARFPMPAFHMQHVDPSRGGVPAGHQPDPMLSSLMMQNSRQPRMPNFVDPYQQYMGLHHLHMQQPQQNQNQAAQQGTSKPSTSKGAENLESPRSG